MNLQRIGLIGHGEVGKIFTSGLKGKHGVSAIGAWDAQPASDAAAST